MKTTVSVPAIGERSAPVTFKGAIATGGTQAGVFASNRARPVHRWYPFIEGFSAELVDEVLRAAPDTSRVFDPFAGCGTTPLASSARGVASFFCEVNPYLAWVTGVKVNVTREIQDSGDSTELLRFADQLERTRVRDGSLRHPLVTIDAQRDFFPSGVARRVVAILDRIDAELDGAPRELARLACATSLIPASNMIRRTDLRRRTSGDPPPLLLEATVATQLRAIHEDCRATTGQLRASTTRVGADVRALTKQTHLFDLVITSPPYLNGTNYCRNTKLELLALGFLAEEDELANVRDNSITAGINNVSKRRPSAEVIPAVERVAIQLDAVAYDGRIPTLVRSYFSDMRLALRSIRRSTRNGAGLLLDIGDSRFAGVHVPTPDLLAQIAEGEGWRLCASETLRTRRSYDGTELSQVLLKLRAT